MFHQILERAFFWMLYGTIFSVTESAGFATYLIMSGIGHASKNGQGAYLRDGEI